jgi:succinate dehydrogenase/fumarate reductase flavoprotein subunit
MILEVENLFEVAEIMIRTAIMRKETRTMFLRDDYTEMDNKNWLKHIVVKKRNGEMCLEAVPLNLTYVKPLEGVE